MKKTRGAPVGILTVTSLAVLLGCGGGGGGEGSATDGSSGSTIVRHDATITSGSATMDDGAHFASLGLVASQSGTAKITVSSSAFDPMVVIEKVNVDGTSEVVAEDDDGGGGTSAEASFAAVSGTHYTVLTTSANGDPSGAVAISYSSKVLSPDGRGRSVSIPKESK